MKKPANVLHTIRAPASLWERVKEAAQREDRTVSSWIRRVIEEAL